MPAIPSSRPLRQRLTHSAARLLRPLWLACAAALTVLPAPARAADTPPAGYTRCVGEGQACSFTGAAIVVYGAGATWSSPRSFTGGTTCSNSVFGDPLFGVVKSCYYQAGATPPPPPPPPPPASGDTPPAGYIRCAGENQACSFTGAASVIYGAHATWSNPRGFTGGTACSNGVFGDPLFGVVKSCYYKADAALQFSLGLTLIGTGSVGFSDGSACNSSCAKAFGSGTSVTLSASPAAGFSFGGWGGACAGSSSSCVVAMTAAKSVSANFFAAPTTRTLTLTLTGSGGVGFSDGGSCTTSCAKTVGAGTPLTLAASPSAGFTFNGWTGACAGASPTCTLTMDAAKAVGALFTAIQAPSGSLAARIFYSDLDSGPNAGGLNDKGVFVTVYGKNFGATRGGSTVKVGGGAVDNYVSWSDTKIVVQLGAAAKTGDIAVVNASGQASNGVPFTVRPGAIYFVAPNGTGNGSIASPMSPGAAYAAITQGATLYFRQGSYNGKYGAGYSGYNYVLGKGKGGVAGQPVTFVGYPGETATFSGNAAAFSDDYRGIFMFRDDDIRNGDSAAARADYVTVANLRMVCGSTCLHSAASSGNGLTRSGAMGIRVVGNVMSATYTNNTATGLISVGNNGWRIFGNELKDTGTTPPINNNHAIYIQVGASDVDVGWNYLHDLRMGHLIQVHTDIESKHEDVRIHDNLLTAADPMDSRGINIGETLPGSYGSIYNNVLHNLGQEFSAICIYSGEWKIFNNTMHAIKASPGMILVNSSDGRHPVVTVSNNIFYSNGSSPYVGMHFGTTAEQVTGANNLFFNAGAAPAFDKAAVNANPLFVNAAAGNLRLQGASPAINKGTAAVSSVVTRDADGVARPQQGAFDIGAFEYAP